MEFLALAQQCAPNVSPHTIAAIVQVESSFNPYAIGVVNGSLKQQPKSKAEALAAVNQLLKQNKNFSVGIAQINRYNLSPYNLSYEQAFDACHSINVGAQILEKCFIKAREKYPKEDEQAALKRAFSCYYSGNFLRGFKPDKQGDISYVDKVVNTAINQSQSKKAIQVVVPAVAVPNNYLNTPLPDVTVVYTPPKTYPVLLKPESLPDQTPNQGRSPVLVFSRSEHE